MTDLLETTEDGIAWLALNRPDRLNALSPAMLTALGEALQRLSEDPEAGAVVITGAGRGFCAGGDVKTMPSRAIGRYGTQSRFWRADRPALGAGLSGTVGGSAPRFPNQKQLTCAVACSRPIT